MNKNIVLIGMPGSGKTTVGQLLAEELGLPLADLDLLIEKAAGRSIPEIFAQEGESGFRDWESAVVKENAKREGIVIATGGGVILRPENMEALAQTGIIFFRDRDLEEIMKEDHSGRPLVGADRDRLKILYASRIHLYRKYAQYTISNTETAAEAASQIAAIYREACRT